MKLTLIILSAIVFVFSASQIFAHGGEDHGESKEFMIEEKGSMMRDMDEHHSELPNVGNAICPVSGELIADVGEGMGVQIEHEGKVYNVCCKFCARDFRKDPAKFIKIIESHLAEKKDPGRDYEMNHDDVEHGDSDHKESDHGEHDNDE